MIEDSHFRNYRYVMEYDTEQRIDEKLIKNLLQETIFTTPSKQNMMPYRVHVIGPKEEKIRHLLYNACSGNEDKVNEDRAKKHKVIYQYKNIFTAPYIFLFTQRVSNANPFFQRRIDKGFFYEQCDNLKLAEKTALIEMGMFAHNFGSLCIQNNIDISHTRCIPIDKSWDEPEFYFLQYPVQLIMTAGKGKVYRRDPSNDGGVSFDLEYKPAFDEVISFI